MTTAEDTEEAGFSVDVVVIGAGMSGLTVAATAVQAGLSVAVVEVADQAGGSAIMSEGYVWTAPSREVFLEQDPAGDVAKFELMLQSLDEAFEWLRSLGVSVGQELTQILGYGAGRQIDVHAFIQRALVRIDQGDNVVLYGSRVERILQTDGRVAGVLVVDQGEDGGRIDCRAVVIATGGFQGDAKARADLMFDGAADLTPRSNVNSRGAGIALGRSLGADLQGPEEGFYGHLIPYPMEWFTPSDFASLAQYFSDHGILLSADGRRFTDESLGDHVNAEEVATRGRALLVIDERIRRTEVLRPFIRGMESVDKLAAAGNRGAHYATAATVPELMRAVEQWGYDAETAIRTIEDFNIAIESFESVVPARAQLHNAIIEPPFAALDVQAAITFTYRGLATDLQGRVLGNGRVIAGLFAAGADVGGLNVRGYTGGLVRGLALGRQTAKTIAAELT